MIGVCTHQVKGFAKVFVFGSTVSFVTKQRILHVTLRHIILEMEPETEDFQAASNINTNNACTHNKR